MFTPSSEHEWPLSYLPVFLWKTCIPWAMNDTRFHKNVVRREMSYPEENNVAKTENAFSLYTLKRALNIRLFWIKSWRELQKITSLKTKKVTIEITVFRWTPQYPFSNSIQWKIINASIDRFQNENFQGVLTHVIYLRTNQISC